MSAPGTSAQFTHAGFFVLRTPALPFDVLRPGTGGQADFASRLRDLASTPSVREAVFVASPSLDEQLGVLQSAPGSPLANKVEQALGRYVVRMAGRATPFGLFAACSVGRVGGRATRLSVNGPRSRHTRLDMDYVQLLGRALASDPELLPALRFTPNSSLYRIGRRARYQEVRRQEDGWTHHRATVEVPDYLEAVLARAEHGATQDELALALIETDPGATEAEVSEYVRELISQQVLVSELVPAVTGPEPVHDLIDRLRRISPAGAAVGQLAGVRDDLAALDAGGVGAAPDRYRAVGARLAALPAKADPSRLFQVDLVRPGGATLGENVVAEIARGVELLRRIAPRAESDALSAFRRAFVARFGDSPVTREVPLTEALDEEAGVGFGEAAATVEASSLLEGLDVRPRAARPQAWTPREAHLLGLVTAALATGRQELVLTEPDVERLATDDPAPLPDSFAAMARLEAASGEAVARGDFRLFLGGASGPSGARMLGRFCHADPALAAAVDGYLRSEEVLRPDAVFAEIVHLPEGRAGNILSRPVCRPFEIPCLGRSGAPADRQLPLSDLRVSVEGTRVVLRSVRLGKEVIPRLTSAHNFGASQGVYAFLCALQGQGVASAIGWDWGPLAQSAFLPRVSFGRLVLARAQWRVFAAESARLSAANMTDRAAAVARWRDERRLPRWICMVEGDNELVIDLDDPLMVAMLLDRLSARRDATLCELFPGPDALCAAGDDGRYQNELVVPFLKRAPAPAGVGRLAPARARPTAPCRRVFAPGSDWLSLKLYGASVVVDQLVRVTLGPLASRLVDEGAARLWFFVRYADPHGHLRLRFAGDARRLWNDVLPRVQEAVAPLVEEGSVWKVQLDTYEREVERYGGPAGIDACEQLFHLDSRAAVELLGLPADDPRGDRRWRSTLLGMTSILDGLGLGPADQAALLGSARETMRADLEAGGTRLSGVGAKYRSEAAEIAKLLSADDGDWAAEREILERHRADAAPEAAELRRAAAEGRLTMPLPGLAASLLHMHCNRMLRSAHQLQELVLYELLHRVCAGRLARDPARADRSLEPLPALAEGQRR